ncbi:unnamed protein product [Gordionus sp. m RMFG-2023]
MATNLSTNFHGLSSYMNGKDSDNIHINSTKAQNIALIEGIDCFGNERQVLLEQAKFFNNPWLSDILIRVGEEKFYAHKLILVRASEVFERMLSDEWNDSPEKELILIEEKECINVFTKFLRYLYGCHIILNAEDALPILVLADKYNVTDLRHVAIQYAINNIIPRLQLKDLFHIWFQYATKCYHSPLIMACISSLADKMDDITSLDEWKSEWNGLDKDQLIEILKCSDLVIKDEYQLWLAVERWLLVKVQNDITKAIELIADVLPFVRFPMMTADQLCEVEINSKLAHQFPALFAPHLASAYKHHALSLTSLAHYFNNTSASSCNNNQTFVSPPFQDNNVNHNRNVDNTTNIKSNLGSDNGNTHVLISLLSPLFFNAYPVMPNPDSCDNKAINNNTNSSHAASHFSLQINGDLNHPNYHNPNANNCANKSSINQPIGHANSVNIPSSHTFLLRNYTDELRWDKRLVVPNLSKVASHTELVFYLTTRSSSTPHSHYDWELKVHPRGFGPAHERFRCTLGPAPGLDRPRSVEYSLALVNPLNLEKDSKSEKNFGEVVSKFNNEGGSSFFKCVAGRKCFTRTRYPVDTLAETDKRVDLSDVLPSTTNNFLEPFLTDDRLVFQLVLRPIE